MFNLGLGPALSRNTTDRFALWVRLTLTGEKTLRPMVPPRNSIPVGLMKSDIRGSSLRCTISLVLSSTSTARLEIMSLMIQQFRMVSSTLRTLTEKPSMSTLKFVPMCFLITWLNWWTVHFVSGFTTTVLTNTGTLSLMTMLMVVTVLTILFCLLVMPCFVAQVTSSGRRQASTGLISRVSRLPGYYFLGTKSVATNFYVTNVLTPGTITLSRASLNRRTRRCTILPSVHTHK